MNKILLLSLTFILFATLTCRKDLTGIREITGEIRLFTDKNSYSVTDTIHVTLENQSDFNIVVYRRCDVFPEMVFQKKEDTGWSDDMNFWFMNLRCPTHLDTIRVNNTLNFPFTAEWFKSTGTFRLLYEVFIPAKERGREVISNVFEIE